MFIPQQYVNIVMYNILPRPSGLIINDGNFFYLFFVIARNIIYDF